MNIQELFPLEWTGWFSLLSKGLWGVFSNSTVQKHQSFGAQLSLSEKAMAPHSSTLAWEIPWTEDPGGLQSIGSLRVGHDWLTSLSLFTFTHWRGKWQTTPVFLPGESQGWGSLVGCCVWGRTVRHDWRDLAAATAAAYNIYLIYYLSPPTAVKALWGYRSSLFTNISQVPGILLPHICWMSGRTCSAAPSTAEQ